jgi:hypothetical protein
MVNDWNPNYPVLDGNHHYYLYLQHYLIEHACIWIFLTLICVNWRKELEKESDGVCGCSFGEPLEQETFQTSIYSNTCLKIISFCSFESVGQKFEVMLYNNMRNPGVLSNGPCMFTSSFVQGKQTNEHIIKDTPFLFLQHTHMFWKMNYLTMHNLITQHNNYTLTHNEKRVLII